MWANKASSTGAAVALPRCGWITTCVYTKPGPGALLDLSNVSEEGFPIVKQSQIPAICFTGCSLSLTSSFALLDDPPPKKAWNPSPSPACCGTADSPRGEGAACPEQKRGVHLGCLSPPSHGVGCPAVMPLCCRLWWWVMGQLTAGSPPVCLM